MKLSHVLAAVIALMLMTELLVGADGGVLTNLQQNAAPVAAPQTLPSPAPAPSVNSAPVRSNPWNIGEDEVWTDRADPLEAEVQPSDAASEPSGQDVTPESPPRSAAPPPDIPQVPLPKPRLTAAGPQINYPDVAER
jgi:hypothetical protein